MLRRLFLLGLALVLVLLMASVSLVSAQSTTVLRVATTSGVTTWDPSLSFSTEAIYLANIYEPLLWVDSDGEFVPALATDWSVSDDGLTWTFNLRQGVTFHDGAALTADAVVRSIQRHQEIGGASFIWFPLDSIEAVDDSTVQMNLGYPAPMELIASSLYGAWIVSPDALDAAAADESYFEAGIGAGSGPYMLADYTPDAEVVLAAFPDYWGGWEDDQFQNILFSIIADDLVQEQMLLGGQVDFATRLPSSSYASFASNDSFTVLDYATFFNYVGFFNVNNPPLDDVRVRQAISYAIPYDDVIAVGVEGRGTQARGPVPAGVFPYSEDVPQYTYDLDRARALMAEAGYADGGIDLVLTYAAENAVQEAFTPLLRDSLSEIGINVTIEPMLFNAQWQRARGDAAGRQDIFLLLYWPTYSDAGSDNLWSMFRSSSAPFFNLSYWVNADFDALIDEAGALSGSDLDAAQALYTQAMTLLVEEAPGLFFMDVGTWYAVPNYLTGYEYNPNYAFAHFFYPVRLAQ